MRFRTPLSTPPCTAVRTLVAIPMKDPAQSKSRLSPALSPARRQRLALALFDRTLRFFRTAFPQFDVLVVTASAAVAERSSTAGAAVLNEQAEHGLNAAAVAAAGWAVDRAYARLILVPADIPVLLREEVERMLALGSRCELAIAEARDGGTNMLLMTPPRAFAFQYGHESARRHEAAAHALGMRACRCTLPFMAHDLDTPADCLVLTQALHDEQPLLLARSAR